MRRDPRLFGFRVTGHDLERLAQRALDATSPAWAALKRSLARARR
ncbi:hypothetical protein [Massilia frigida]|nr:hypothetical protein [Massilia frigida]